MMCTNPVKIKNPNGVGLTPGWIEVPCGKCIACRIQKTKEWSVRLLHESVYWEESVFVTLTYDEEHLPIDESLDKGELQRFFKRLRKELNGEIKYFACGEYGDRFQRPHYHAIIFGLSFLDSKIIQEAWSLGFILAKPISYESIKYVAGYVRKKIDGPLAKKLMPGKTLAFQLQSKGLGKRFAEENKDFIEQNFGVTVNGVPHGLPKYYRQFVDLTTEQLYERSLESEQKVKEKFEEMGFDSSNDESFSRLKGFAAKARNRNLLALYKAELEKRK